MMVSELIQIIAQNTPDTKLVLHLLLRNQTPETILLRPTIDDWVVDDNQIFSLISEISPPFVALVPQGEIQQRITLQLPSHLLPDQKLKSWLRFPGLHEQAIPIQVEIVSPEAYQGQSSEVDLQLTFPLENKANHPSQGNAVTTTEGIFWLMPLLMDLDKIPCRWLVAELLVKLCQQGAEYSHSPSGKQLLAEINSTAFFQVGVMALSSAQLPTWIADTLSIEKQILGAAHTGENYLLYIWESWLLSLVDTDIEINQGIQGKRPAPFLLEDFVSEFGLDVESWLANLLLGIAQISSRMKATLTEIISTNSALNADPNKVAEASYGLITGLASLDTLTVRWLVVELFLLLAQKGEDYSTTETGSQLLSQLGRTRFFKNGILSFASAQVPRWLHISQAASSAYHQSLGHGHTQGGLIYAGEQWLRSLVPRDMELENTKYIASDDVMEALVKKMGMDSDRWFAYGVLGLAQISPRIANTLQEIADKAPKQLAKKPLLQFKMEDILSEGNSLQR